MSFKEFPPIFDYIKRKTVSTFELMCQTRAYKNLNDDAIHQRQYQSVRRTDSMESLANFIEDNMAHFENTNPGPLFPLSEYGITCFMRGCEEMHIECTDKTHSVVAHCDCTPRNPNAKHRHIFTYSDLLEPPQPSPRSLFTTAEFLDVDAIRRLLILSHPHYPGLSARSHHSTKDSTPLNDDSDMSSVISFEIQVRTTTPEDNVITSSLFKSIRLSEDARELSIQPAWWNSRSDDIQATELPITPWI